MYLDKLNKEQATSLEKYLSEHAFKGKKIQIEKTVFDSYEIDCNGYCICEINDFESEPCYLNITKALNNKMTKIFGEEYLKDAKKFFHDQYWDLSNSLKKEMQKDFFNVKYIEGINNRMALNEKVQEHLSKLSEKVL